MNSCRILVGWDKDKDFIDCLNEVEAEDINSLGMFFTWYKSPSKPTSSVMKKLDRIMNGNLQEKIEKCRDKLKRAQVLMENNPYDDQLKEEGANCLSLYLEAVGDEESFMMQQAKLDWISKGKKFEGNDVAEQFVSHFKRFLGAENECDDLDVRNLFQKKISHDDAYNMVKEITDNEIKEAMFDIGDNKSLGPDGFTSTFFKKSWNVIGKDVTPPKWVAAEMMFRRHYFIIQLHKS
ncbi:hypothetical protein Tco_0140059 [Tanacetum coccineum]